MYLCNGDEKSRKSRIPSNYTFALQSFSRYYQKGTVCLNSKIFIYEYLFS